MSYWPVALYTLAVLIASLLGGLIPILVKLTHRSMQLAISFVAGVMLGAGLLHMMPHSLLVLRDPRYTLTWVTGGFLVTFFVQRFLLIHHHAVPHDHDETHSHHHEGEAAALECGQRQLVAERYTWSGAALGLALHGLISGISMAAAFESQRENSAWPGSAVFLAVLIHKPFDSLTIITLMAAEGWRVKTCHLVNAIFSLMIPTGVLLFLLGLQSSSSFAHQILGCSLAFSSGTFLCIAASDLLPEMQLHSHDRGELSVCLLAGVSLVYLIETLSV